MKSIKYLLCALLATIFVGCAEEVAFEPGPADNGAQISFETSSLAVQLMPTDPTEYEIKISRADNDAAATYEVELTEGKGSEGIFSLEAGKSAVVSKSLEFAEGQTESSITLSFAEAAIGVGYKAKLAITGENVAIYKPILLDFSVIRQYTWEVLADAEGNTEAVWVDEALALYSIPPVAAPVTVYEAKERPGYLKVTGLYRDDFFMAIAGVSAAEFGVIVPSTPVDIFVNAENPDAVWIPFQSTGMIVDAAYGVMEYGSVCEENGFTASYYGTLKDNVISFDTNTIVIREDLFPDDLYNCNTNGAMGLSLPGAEPVAEVIVSYVGLFSDAATKTDNAVIDFSVNDNTSYVKYALVEGKGVDVEAIAAQIVDGSIESTKVDSFDANVYVAVPAVGTYTVVAAPFNENENVGICSSVSFKIAGSEAPVLAINEGEYSITVADSEGEGSSNFYVMSTEDENVFVMSDIFGFGTQIWYTCQIDRDNDLAYITPGTADDEIGYLTSFAYFDEEKTQVCCYVGDGNAGTEPWILEMSEVDGKYEPSAAVTAMALGVFNAEDGSYLGTAALVGADTAIARVGDIPAEAPAKGKAVFAPKKSKVVAPAGLVKNPNAAKFAR